MTDIQPAFTLDAVVRRIFDLRGQRIMLDADLALLYGVETKNLLRAVKRNLERFPKEFMFQLSKVEWENLRSQCVIANVSVQNRTAGFWSGRRRSPYAFTKHGALMLSSVLNSSLADEISLLIIRSFVWLRQAIPGHKDLAAKVAELENARHALRLHSSILFRQIMHNTKWVFERKQ
ncbi:MAG: ORF6N domain-containing protein [Deltaproteobacteria bacterium]|jgi:hypothetical protein|nr:ORF6N domain-containing protein [Deltaproteobacteria bacterium]